MEISDGIPINDYEGIHHALSRFDRGGMWTVVRRGRPSARVRVIYRGAQEPAKQRYDAAAAAMRQGMVALIDDCGGVVRYASEPMCRTRW